MKHAMLHESPLHCEAVVDLLVSQLWESRRWRITLKAIPHNMASRHGSNHALRFARTPDRLVPPDPLFVFE